jgi:hypothetical protein
MTKRHSLPEDLHRVAGVAGTTAVLAEGAAAAAERAEAAAAKAQELAAQAQEEVRSHRTGVLLVLVLVALGVIGLVIWRRSRSRTEVAGDDVDVPLEPLDLTSAGSA